MKRPDFQKNFSGSIEYFLKIALYYEKDIDEETINEALELEGLKRIADKANNDFEERQRFIRWKREQKQKEVILNGSKA